MVTGKTTLLTVVAMLAFAANSLLCRQALEHTNIDPALFTAVRIVSGALMLAGILIVRGDSNFWQNGSWLSALYSCWFPVVHGESTHYAAAALTHSQRLLQISCAPHL